MTRDIGDETGDRGAAPRLVSVRDEDMVGALVNIPLAKLNGGGLRLAKPLEGGFILFSFCRLCKKTVGYWPLSIELRQESLFQYRQS